MSECVMESIRKGFHKVLDLFLQNYESTQQPAWLTEPDDGYRQQIWLERNSEGVLTIRRRITDKPGLGMYLDNELGERATKLFRTFPSGPNKRTHSLQFDCHGMAMYLTGADDWVLTSLEAEDTSHKELFYTFYKNNNIMPSTTRPPASVEEPVVMHLVTASALERCDDIYKIIEEECLHSAVLIGEIEGVDIYIDKRGTKEVRMSTLEQMSSHYGKQTDRELVPIYIPLRSILESVNQSYCPARPSNH